MLGILLANMMRCLWYAQHNRRVHHACRVIADPYLLRVFMTCLLCLDGCWLEAQFMFHNRLMQRVLGW